MTCSSSKTDAPEDQGLRILARIIARDWAKRYLPRGCAELRVDDATTDKKLVAEAEPVPSA